MAPKTWEVDASKWQLPPPPKRGLWEGAEVKGQKKGRGNHLLSPLPGLSHLTLTATQGGSYLHITAEETVSSKWIGTGPGSHTRPP